jgi:hypothetical protein
MGIGAGAAFPVGPAHVYSHLRAAVTGYRDFSPCRLINNAGYASTRTTSATI